MLHVYNQFYNNTIVRVNDWDLFIYARKLEVDIGLVLGITALVGTIAVDRSFYRLNWPVMMLFSIVLYYFLYNDNQLVPFEGLVLFSFLVAFLIVLIKQCVFSWIIALSITFSLTHSLHSTPLHATPRHSKKTTCSNTKE